MHFLHCYLANNIHNTLLGLGCQLSLNWKKISSIWETREVYCTTMTLRQPIHKHNINWSTKWSNPIIYVLECANNNWRSIQWGANMETETPKVRHFSNDFGGNLRNLGIRWDANEGWDLGATQPKRGVTNEKYESKMCRKTGIIITKLYSTNLLFTMLI